MTKGRSHNPERPSYSTTSAEYLALFARLEEEFDIEELTPGRLKSWLRHDTFIDLFTLSREIYLEAQTSGSISDLRRLKEEAKELLVHKDFVNDFIDNKIDELTIEQRELEVAREMAIASGLAQKKGIVLREGAIYRIYDKWGRGSRRAVVIRVGSRIRAWKYV